MTVIPEIPHGAIENGRVFLQRLADHYDFACEAGSLANCTDYHEAVRCFEFIAQWASELTAAQPFLQGVKVKALEWINPPLSDTLSRCETEFGTYRTWTHSEANGKWFWSVEGGFNNKNGDVANEEAAKAAAQSDYEARILSAIDIGITVSEPSPRAQALEEAELAVGATVLKHNSSDYEGLDSLEAYEAGQLNGLERAQASLRTFSYQPIADGWLPIETAPKDTYVLAWGDNFHWRGVEKAYVHSDYNGHVGVICKHGVAGTPFSGRDAPTHWRPLPTSPGASE